MTLDYNKLRQEFKKKSKKLERERVLSKEPTNIPLEASKYSVENLYVKKENR